MIAGDDDLPLAVEAGGKNVEVVSGAEICRGGLVGKKLPGKPFKGRPFTDGPGPTIGSGLVNDLGGFTAGIAQQGLNLQLLLGQGADGVISLAVTSVGIRHRSPSPIEFDNGVADVAAPGD